MAFFCAIVGCVFFLMYPAWNTDPGCALSVYLKPSTEAELSAGTWSILLCLQVMPSNVFVHVYYSCRQLSAWCQ